MQMDSSNWNKRIGQNHPIAISDQGQLLTTSNPSDPVNKCGQPMGWSSDLLAAEAVVFAGFSALIPCRY